MGKTKVYDVDIVADEQAEKANDYDTDKSLTGYDNLSRLGPNHTKEAPKIPSQSFEKSIEAEVANIVDNTKTGLTDAYDAGQASTTHPRVVPAITDIVG
ncbi:hypothetical protein QYF36_018935 [Acer negundo]|nr:hypothetical protein QYF36_018935 [Acer negundo]